jgi:AcrR family transcriptional regulator
MYHVKDDIRARRSSELLYKGLLAMLQEKDFSKVTISDISRVSTVGRATFYRNFDETADILWWKCDQEFSEVLTSFVRSEPKLEQQDELLLYVLRYWMGHSKDLETLMGIGRLDIIYDCFVDNASILLDYLHEHGIKMSTQDYGYFIAVRAGFFVGMMRAWMENGKHESAEEVANIVSEQHGEVVAAGVIA